MNPVDYPWNGCEKREKKETVGLQVKYSDFPRKAGASNGAVKAESIYEVKILLSKHDWSRDEMLVAGHRGFKGRVAENTIEGFTRCYDAGATIFETDVWISQDGVLVVSHDAWTTRAFIDESGNEANHHIPDTSFREVLANLKTAGNGEPLLRLAGVLKWYVEDNRLRSGPGQYRIMLDIKRKNPPRVARLIVEALLSAHNDIKWWYSRVQFAIWDLDVVRFINQDPYFAHVFTGEASDAGYTQFDVLHISVSWQDSMRYVDYNCYLDRAKITRPGMAQNLKLYAWTVNTREQYDFVDAVGKRARLCEYGVISDWPDAMATITQSLDRAVTESLQKSSREASREALLGEEPHMHTSDLSKLRITLNQRICYWMYSMFARLVRSSQPPVVHSTFDTIVDGDVVRDVSIPTFYSWVFQTLQAYNIF